ncbi:A/G-specific adenine glycosylase [Anaerobacillus isosaccharinicus]|uniref:Adenine DNA glycosylase n=1 Tax=Anaerobacillus isosaccharinicus TaxID=1532552 RepID=A0A1S2M6Q8_9BACI|nr:A/G-specific adenine glycosylase [Anaerobacillus isosaccharinicus]MBA5584928.1 A/G-specific adenine glycosylase [Anaerobacillus isosaccharinicus]QOY36714.1 A/G-specific adenine glycosylase [Anaerobacillus isosaccharinicus]
MQLENKTSVKQFQHDLLTWFKGNQRDLPWRQDQDPYKVWVSEIMLQQTRVDTVIPFFNRFLEKFPTIEALAIAEEGDVLKAWEGLGYYSRARNLQAAVREVHEQYNGVVPNSKAEISKLRGVGPYTSGAILSIAYGKPEPAVDGNVMRVISRIVASYDDISKQKTRVKIEGIISTLISVEDPSSFNQGLMELGALICTPTSPACSICPIQKHCKAFEEKVQLELPVKAKKKKPKEKKLVCAFIKNAEGQVLIHQRHSTGLLASLWEFPNVELNNDDHIEKQLEVFLRNEFGIQTSIGKEIFRVEHVFSHLKWDVTVFEVELLSSVKKINERAVWISDLDIKAYPFPVSHQKIMSHCLKI